jgi:hypothetical protein
MLKERSAGTAFGVSLEKSCTQIEGIGGVLWKMVWRSVV